MLTKTPTNRALEKLISRRFSGVLNNCGNENRPGTDESPKNRNWSARPTTRDQARIEEYIAPLLTSQSRILHIGIGNSSLAKKFTGKTAHVVGITISPAEAEHAASLNLANYEVRLINKYGNAFVDMPGQFDFIIDNNPSTFACCTTHFWRMMTACKDKLRDGGTMVTDKAGLAHLASDAPGLEHWRFTPLDWLAVAEALGLNARRHGSFVLSMSKK